MNEIFFLLGSDLHNFPDNNTVVAEIIQGLINSLEVTTSNVIEWMKDNDMIPNPDKFKAIVLTKLVIIQLVLDCNLCIKYRTSTSLLSTLMTRVKNISNWPDPGGPKWDMTQNYSLSPYKGNFPEKTKNNKSTWICLKYNLTTSLLSTLMTYVKNISNWPDPGRQKMDMTQNHSLLWHKGNFPGKSKNNNIWPRSHKRTLAENLKMD